MTKLDQFESIFRAAEREIFLYQEIPLRSVLVVTDQEPSAAEQYGERVRRFLRVVGQDPQVRWRVLHNGHFRSAEELLEMVEEDRPDLICTYRNLHSRAWRWPFSLGEHLDVLTQVAITPVIVLPHPQAGEAGDHTLLNTDSVMVITDHLTGDHRLVNHAVRFTEPRGTLYLSHIEDDAALQHILKIIAKIPTIDTDNARETLREMLLKEPQEFIRSCRHVLREQGLGIQIESIVAFGHYIHEYRRLVEEHKVDLLVLNTKDEDQLAMHGRAYPLAVELRQTPLLML